MIIFSPSKWSLGRKFASMLLLILLIPFASVGLLKEIEKTLENSLRENLMLTTQILGGQLSNRKDWFEQSLLPDTSQFIGNELFVFPLNSSFELDAYFNDWLDFEQHRRVYSSQSSSFGVLLGNYKRHLVLSLQVKDISPVYPSADIAKPFDQFEVEFKRSNGEYQQVYLSSRVSGSFPVKSFSNGNLKIDWRYKGMWNTTEDGYNIELKFPSGFKPDEIRIIHHDVNNLDKQLQSSEYSSSRYDLNPIVWPSPNIVKYFEQIKLAPAQRIWLIDSQRRVLASAGDLQASQMTFSRNSWFNWLLARQSDIERDPRKNNLRLDSKEIYGALKGESNSAIENVRGTEKSIALAAFPIKINDKIYGALLLEENVASVQILQKKTLFYMIMIVLLVFSLVMGVIFWYVSKMVARIKYLNSSIAAVVDPQGRINSPLSLEIEEGDEISDLYRSVNQMGSKLFEYNDYLEKLASRLSHELRTPIAIVRSSLDNLMLNCQVDDDKIVIARALEGNKRLGEIITRMRQASGVKDAMQNAQKQVLDVNAFVAQLAKGYQFSFIEHKFEHQGEEGLMADISNDLFAEMFDKLISNAMAFCTKGTVIKIQSSKDSNGIIIAVTNQGQTIEKKNLKKIFQSLVSIRNTAQSTGANLGLGLYVVRLIIEFHGGSVVAKNLEDGSGVSFILRLPIV